MRSKSLAALLYSLFVVIAFSGPVFAGNDISLPLTFTQSQFDDLSRELGLAISYVPLSPAAPLGLLGFDIGIEGTAAHIDNNKSFWTEAIGKTPPSYLAFPKIHAQKGLPFGFDVGLVYAKAPGSNVGLVGGELKWAILKGGLASPAIAIRGDYTKLLGVSDIDMRVYGADISISKGFGFITPYAGYGVVWISSQDKSNVGNNINIDTFSSNESKGFVGVKFSAFIVSFVAEADYSKVPSYSGRLNFSF
jgi:hypothetical protein